MKIEQEESAIGIFALACERLNDFARSLRRRSGFGKVRSRADIRRFENGWRLQKWVEAELDPEEGWWARWWLEIGPSPTGGWIVESSLSISPHGAFISLAETNVNTTEELERCLIVTVDNLEHALEQNTEFAEEVKNLNKGVKS